MPKMFKQEHPEDLAASLNYEFYDEIPSEITGSEINNSLSNEKKRKFTTFDEHSNDHTSYELTNLNEEPPSKRHFSPQSSSSSLSSSSSGSFSYSPNFNQDNQYYDEYSQQQKLPPINTVLE